MLCKPPSSFTASMGIPMGLTASAIPRRIRPLVTEVVSRTSTASRPRTALAIWKIKTVWEIRPAQEHGQLPQLRQVQIDDISVNGHFP